MIRNGLKAAVFSVVAALVALPATAADLTIRHARGEISVPAVPARIVVLDVVSLDTLATLGVSAIVGVPSGGKPDYLADYAGGKVAEVGSLFEPDYAAVKAAAPDLIIVGGRSAAKFDDLAKIAPTIDMTVDGDNFAKSAEGNVLELAALFGKTDEARTLLEKLHASTAVLKEKAPSAGKTLFLLTTGGKLSAYGANSRFGRIHSDFGFLQADEAIKPGNRGQSATFEYILEKNPDAIVLLDRDEAIGRSDGQAAKALLDNDTVRQTTAWKNNKVIHVGGAIWYLVPGGLTSMQKTVDELLAAVNES